MRRQPLTTSDPGLTRVDARIAASTAVNQATKLTQVDTPAKASTGVNLHPNTPEKQVDKLTPVVHDPPARVRTYARSQASTRVNSSTWGRCERCGSRLLKASLGLICPNPNCTRIVETQLPLKDETA